jgi:alanine-glyoxylate transaminase/serine-glyoxylate transaminase/serine-pyruvate transaminase
MRYEVRLFTPGPTPIHPWALEALSWPMRSHMDPDMVSFNDDLARDLELLYGAPDGGFACVLSGTGSFGMEVGFANLLEPGETAVIASNGVFGERMIDMAGRLGVEVTPVRFPTGLPISPGVVREALVRVQPKVLAVVHGETSTGVLNPIEELGIMAAEFGALFTVDAVTTVGMLRFDMASWGIDYAYTGSQKCLSAPPGLAPVAFSPRALINIKERVEPVSTWYGDVNSIIEYWRPSGERRYHHTVPVQLHWATGEAVKAVLEEGIAKRTARAKVVANACIQAFDTIGFKPFVPAEFRLPTVLALTLPEGIDDLSLRNKLRVDHGISLTGGLGETTGKIWRLGLMGETAYPHHYRHLMIALADLLGAPHLPETFDQGVAVC